jgi:hypothetical protein
MKMRIAKRWTVDAGQYITAHPDFSQASSKSGKFVK